MSDEAIFTVLARMRSPMIEAHPEWLSGCVSDVEECVLCLEVYQKEQAAEITRLREELAHHKDEISKLRASLNDATKRSNYSWSQSGEYLPGDWQNEGAIKFARDTLAKIKNEGI